MMLLFTCAMLFTLDIVKVISEHSTCPGGSLCIPLNKCSPEYLTGILFPCHNGLNLYCCPSEGVKNDTVTNLLVRSKDLFPKECGVAFIDNKITGGEAADPGQFPWMALLGYKQRNVDFIEYLCGGTIITERYILTAAHCLTVGKTHKLVTVRVGEHNLQTKKDCLTILGVEHCSETPVDLPVMQLIQHPDYNHKKLKHDIALVKVETSIIFTDYVQPICLPFGRNMENTDLTDQKFTISGWGKTKSRNIGGSSILQFAFVHIWNQLECNKVVPPEVQPITDNQICANGRKEDACKGDSGGPLFNASLDANEQLRNFQIGIVSFASTVGCGIEELPAIYTRIDKYLDWIVDSIK